MLLLFYACSGTARDGAAACAAAGYSLLCDLTCRKCSDGAVRSSCRELAHLLGPAVARSKDPRSTRPAVLAGNDISGFIQFHEIRKRTVGRNLPDRNEQAGNRQDLLLTRDLIRDLNARQLPLTDKPGDIAVKDRLKVFLSERLFDLCLIRAELVSSVNKIHVIAEARKEFRVLERRVAASEDCDGCPYRAECGPQPMRLA